MSYKKTKLIFGLMFILFGILIGGLTIIGQFPLSSGYSYKDLILPSENTDASITIDRESYEKIIEFQSLNPNKEVGGCFTGTKKFTVEFSRTYNISVESLVLGGDNGVKIDHCKNEKYIGDFHSHPEGNKKLSIPGDFLSFYDNIEIRLILTDEKLTGYTRFDSFNPIEVKIVE